MTTTEVGNPTADDLGRHRAVQLFWLDGDLPPIRRWQARAGAPS